MVWLLACLFYDVSTISESFNTDLNIKQISIIVQLSLNIKPFLFQTVQFSISTQFSMMLFRIESRYYYRFKISKPQIYQFKKATLKKCCILKFDRAINHGFLRDNVPAMWTRRKPLMGHGCHSNIFSSTDLTSCRTGLYNNLTPTYFLRASHLHSIQPVNIQGCPPISSTGCTCYLHRCISYFDSSAGGQYATIFTSNRV